MAFVPHKQAKVPSPAPGWEEGWLTRLCCWRYANERACLKAGVMSSLWSADHGLSPQSLSSGSLLFRG